jgi:hypothetical protein
MSVEALAKAKAIQLAARKVWIASELTLLATTEV